MTATAESSKQLPASQRVVIIGAGIVGNSLAYHLTQLGETDITLIDKGPMPNPGGSTGHASNFIFPVDHSKEMTLLTLESMRQYKELGVFIESGGIEIARTEERMQELGEGVGNRAGVDADTRAGERARSLHQRGAHHRWVLYAWSRSRRQPARGDDHARARPGGGSGPPRQH